MKITMIGSGYVGLVSGACFADVGHNVTCVDKDHKKIDALKGGAIPIFEPGLSQIVARNVAAGRLSFTTDLGDCVGKSDAVFIAVGTPSRKEDGHADLTYVHQAAAEIAEKIEGFTVIVDKSTVPVGTGDEVERIIREVSPNADFAVVSNPEFLREGAAIDDFNQPDRIVIGGDDPRGLDVMHAIYRPLVTGRSPIIQMSRRAAELTKYAGNAFLATKITFINEMADLCEKVGADVQDIARGIGLDNRIGSKFLHAGPGYGGSCFPKDTLALLKTGQDNSVPLRIVDAVVSANEQRKREMGQKVISAMDGNICGRKIAVLGLAFKPNTDDMRDSPAIAIIQILQDAGASIHAFDPEAMDQAARILNDVTYYADAQGALQGADALVIVTEWNEFCALDLKHTKESMDGNVFVDLRNIYPRDQAEKAGFLYFGVGR
jgi:UDPglucose 6-dehydrogenase